MTILEDFQKVKATIDAIHKPEFDAFVTGHPTMNAIANALPEAKQPLNLLGMKVFPLTGMPEGEILAFPTEKAAITFIRKVEILMAYGCPADKAVAAVRHALNPSSKGTHEHL